MARTCDGVRRHSASRWRRLASLVAAAVLLAGATAPLALAFGAEETGCCRRGHCCCAATTAGDAPCLRTACPCGGHSAGAAVADTTEPEALLPRPVQVPEPFSGRLRRPAEGTALRVGVGVPPDPPPWPGLSDRAVS